MNAVKDRGGAFLPRGRVRIAFIAAIALIAAIAFIAGITGADVVAQSNVPVQKNDRGHVVRPSFGVGPAILGPGMPGYNPGGAGALPGMMSPGPGMPGPGPGMMGNPGPPPAPAWGNPWGAGGWSCSPTIAVNSPSWTDRGETTVMACGYDAMGIWRTIPLHVAYYYNGADYDVTVLSAYNPWTDSWSNGVDMPAYNTNYYINGQTYDFYTNLSTGTYYFNL